MSGTSEGSKQGYEEVERKRGKRFIKDRAAKGGSVKDINKGFRARPELASELGRKGAMKRWENYRAAKGKGA